MKKLLQLTRTLFVAVALLGGTSNAWAGEVSTIYTKALSGWSSDDLTASSSTFTASKWTPSQTGDANRGLWTSTTTGLMTRCRQNTVTGTLTLNRTANTIVTLDAVWNVGDNDNNGAGHTNGNTNSYFQYGDLLIQAYLDNRNTDYYYTINGQKVKFSNVTAGCLLNTDLTIHLKVNSVSGEIAEFYVKNGETILAQFSDLTAANNTFAVASNYDNVITTAHSAVSRTNAFNYLKSITIQQETQDVPTADVTFKYEDTDGNSLSAYKADQVASDVAQGTEISTLISSYNATFYNGEDNKYVYSSYVVEGDYTTVQAGGNTVTLKFTDYPTAAYAVKAQVSGSDLTTLASGTAFLDGSTTNYWSKYINESGQWYVANAATYGTSITSATTNVAFTATEAVSYFFEAENMTASRTYGTISNNTGYSGGAGSGIYLSANLDATTTIPSGTYTISIGSVTRTESKAQSYNISYSTDGEHYTSTGKSISFTTAAGSSEQSVTGVIIPAAAYIRLTEGTGNNAYDYIDYVIAKRTGDATVSAPISSLGWSTFVSPYALDFTGLAGIKAYIVTGHTGTAVNVTQMTGTVPANTPLLLEGSTTNVPVAASSSTDVSDNLLKAGTGAAVSKVDGKTRYVLSINNNGTDADDSDDYAEFQKIDETPATVATNKAYLEFDEEILAPALSFMFDNENTGINAVQAEGLKVNGAYYNLNGQRVATPSKGLYIINGKKVVLK